MSAQFRTPGGVLGGFLGFVGLSAAAGVLATAAITPALAVTGMTANNTIGVFENLPEYLQIEDLAQKTNIYAMRGEEPVLLASFYDQNRVEVGWDQISPYAKDAAIAGEDPRFYEHGGIDIQGTVRAILATYVGGGEVQGGSSITQQYVKNVLVQKAEAAANEEERNKLYAEATETTPERKLKEMKMAIGLEKQYSKDEILLGYLNIALFGGRIYGIEAASNYYFNTTAANLNLEQAATLLAIVNNPEKFRIDRPDQESNNAADGYAATKGRRDYILGQMVREKRIPQELYDAAVAAPVAPAITQPSTGCQTAAGSAYFCDYVTWVIRNDPAFGETEDQRWTNFKRGGYDIYTTVDLDMQNAAETAMAQYVPQVESGMDLGGVIVSVQAGTGRILAMAQNKTYSQDPDVLAQGPQFTSVNYNTDFAYGGSTGFQPGSTYKTFTLAEWINQGRSLYESFNVTKRSSWGTFDDSCLGSWSTPGWSPRNDDNETGSMSILEITARSVNVGFIAMAKELDLCGIANTAKAFGIHRADGQELVQAPATVLGTNEIAPLTMAGAFAGMAAQGVVCKPIAIDRIVGPEGQEIPAPSAGCAQAVDPAVTAGMTFALQRVMSGTAASSQSRSGGLVPHFGKTGTTDNSEATWMSGGSTKVVTVAGLFNVTGHTALRGRSLDNSGIDASGARHYLWPAVQRVADEKYGGDGFPSPNSSSVRDTSVAVPEVRGLSIEEGTAKLEAAGFDVSVEDPQDSDLPEGVISSTDPRGTAPRGSEISIYPSNGQLRVVPDALSGANSFADARKTLEQAGFRNIACTAVGGNPRPTAQDPAPGTPIRPETVVTVTAGAC